MGKRQPTIRVLFCGRNEHVFPHVVKCVCGARRLEFEEPVETTDEEKAAWDAARDRRFDT